MPRIILAFNGDLESRLALHWLVRERNYEVITLSINLGQETYLEPLGELALDLGATAAQVVDRREMFLRDFALPVLQAAVQALLDVATFDAAGVTEKGETQE